MCINTLNTENVLLSIDYYTSLKSISGELASYIKQYKALSEKHYQKLFELNDNYKTKIDKIIEEINGKKGVDFSEFFVFLKSIPRVIDLYNENLNWQLSEIEKEISLYDTAENDNPIPTNKNMFDESKKKIMSRTNDIKSAKKAFFDNMGNTEKMIYNYYFKETNKDKEKSNDHSKKKNVTEEAMNKNISTTRQYEETYRNKVNEVRKEEDEFMKNTKSHCENFIKLANDIFEKSKHLIISVLVSIKNLFNITETELNSVLPDLIQLDDTLKMEEIFKRNSNDDSKFTYVFNADKYKSQFFASNEEDNSTNNKNKKWISDTELKITEIEDGYNKMYYINDKTTLLAIKKIKKNFNLTNLDIDVKVEEEKIYINSLTTKLLSSLKKEKDTNTNSDLGVTEDEIKLIELLLDKRYNIVIFLQKLNKFRATGRFIMNEKIFNIFSKIFNLMLDKIDVQNDSDINSGKSIIILSQTYYLKVGKDEKEYLQKRIMDHPIFKELKFWEETFNFELNKGIQKMYKLDNETSENLLNIIKMIKDNDRKQVGNLAFGQILTLSNNMMTFGMNADQVKKFMEPKIVYYELDNESIKNIKLVLGMDISDNGHNNKEKTEKEKEKENPAEKEKEKESPAEKDKGKESPAEKEKEKESPVEKEKGKESPAEKEKEKEGPAEKEKEKESPAEKEKEKEKPAEK